MLKHLRTVGFGLVLAMPGLAAPPGIAEPDVSVLAGQIDAALKPGLDQGAKVSVRIIDALTGEELLATPDVDEALIPASNMKLVTSATCLDLHGPDATLATTVFLDGGDLWVIGSGDPALGDPALEEDRGRTAMSVLDDWAEALQEQGVTQITGDIVVCDPVFDDQFIHPTWHPANLLYWYGAPVAGVSFNDNCVDFTFVPTELGQPAALELTPPEGGFFIEGRTRTVAEEHKPLLDKKPDTEAPVYVVGGTVARRGGPYSKPVDNPRRFLGETLRAALAERGVAVAGGVRTVTHTPAGLGQMQAIANHETPLLDVLGRVNTNSQNMMAEALAKLNGLAYDRAQGADDPRGSWASGHLAAVAFLKRAGIDTASLVAADGSGLSRENRVTARLVSDLLLFMLREHIDGEHFLNSMAISGVRGSVRNRMREIEGRVYAKTGTISGVSALSGYVFPPNGRVTVFCILHNQIEGSAGPYRKQQDQAVLALYRWLEAQGPLEPNAEPVDQVQEAMELIGVQ